MLSANQLILAKGLLAYTKARISVGQPTARLSREASSCYAATVGRKHFTPLGINVHRVASAPVPMSPSDVSPLLYLLAKVEEAIHDRLAEAETSDDRSAEQNLSELRAARRWLLDLGERELRDD